MGIITQENTSNSLLTSRTNQFSNQLLPERQSLLYIRYKNGENIASIAHSEHLPLKTIRKAIINEWNTILLKRVQGYLPLLKLSNSAEDEFIRSKSAQKIIITQVEYHSSNIGKSRNLKEIPSQLSFLYTTPLLNKEQEFAYFRYLNFLRYKIEESWSIINSKDIKLTDLKNIDILLDKADQIRNKILLSNERLIVSNMKKRLNSNYTVFDALSEMQEPLIIAILKFDYSKGLKFSTFATTCIRNRSIRDYHLATKHNLRFSQASDTIFSEQSIESEAHTNLLNTIELKLSNALLSEISNLLPERDLAVIKMRYGIEPYDKSHKLKEIGNKLGITKERARQIEQRAINKIIDTIDCTKIEASVNQ